MLPDDVHGLAQPVLAHRLLPSVEAVDERPLDRARSSTGSSPSVPVPAGHLAGRQGRRARGVCAGLTVRGRAFVAAGVTAIVCAVAPRASRR